MNSALAFNPMVRPSAGVGRFDDLFYSSLRNGDSMAAFPSYDIVKRGDDEFVISLAVAGFVEEQLNVVVQQDQLLISGRLDDNQQQDMTYLHRGIRNTSFERSFRLAEHMRVTAAELKDGLLQISLLRDVPEDAKPQAIEIRHTAGGSKHTLRSVGQDKS
ncbi:MAG: Hsp20 family protein [Gammaproteobacteria bacterium]|nr:Hsp20 family protein [Gammaproteobacteria bacterium]